MPRKLTADQKLLREQIALLAAHLAQTKRDERAAAKVAKAAEAAAAAARRPPRWQSRLIGRFHKLRKEIADATVIVKANPYAYEAVRAHGVMDSAPRQLAELITSHADLLAPALEGTGLAEWAAHFRKRDRRGPAPVPTSHTENQTS